MPKYDLAVIGAGLAGLSAAALASRSNKRTIVIESGDAIGGVLQAYVKNGFSFYPGPSLSFGFERGGALQQLNEMLGIAQNASLRSPCYQVALPDRRITIYAEQSETLDELRREFPGEIDRIVRFYNDIRKRALLNSKNAVSKLLSSRMTASRLIRNYGFSREFTAFLDVQSYYFFSRPVSSLRQTSLISMVDSAPLIIEGGFRGLADHILDVLLRNGVEIRYHETFENTSLKRGELSLRNESININTILLNARLHDERPSLFIGINEEVVPEGMLHDVICLPDYSRPERFFVVSVSGAGDKAAPSGMRTLSGFFYNSADRNVYELREQMARLIPFLMDFAVFSEEYKPEQSQYNLGLDSKKFSFKPVRKGDNDLLMRSSMRNIFMIADGSGSPCQSIAAVQQLMRYMK